MVTSPVVFHCLAQGNLEEFLTHLDQKNIDCPYVYLYVTSLLQDPSHTIFPNMPHFLHFIQPLGGCSFPFILIDFLYRIFQYDFYASFFRTLRKGGQVSRQDPKTWVRQREGKSGAKLITFSHLLFSFLSSSCPLTKKGEAGSVKRLSESAHQPELPCQICPTVGTALWKTTEGRAHARKLLILLYLHSGAWYPQDKPTKVWEFFPQKVF